jgi:hypothetical protein
MFMGFDLQRAEVRLTEHSHGEETNEMPVAIVVARRPAPPTSES